MRYEFPPCIREMRQWSLVFLCRLFVRGVIHSAELFFQAQASSGDCPVDPRLFVKVLC